MSYLRGPLTRDQVSDLVGDGARSVTDSHVAAAVREPTAVLIDDSATTLMPDVADGTVAYHLDPAAPWGRDIGATPGGTRFEASLAVRVKMVFDDRNARVDHDEEWEAVYYPLGDPFDPAKPHSVDHDGRDFLPDAPAGTAYVLPNAPIHTKTYFSQAEAAIKEALYRGRTIEILRNPSLKVYSRGGESRDRFAERCDSVAQDLADQATAKILDRLEGKMDTVRDQIESARSKVEDASLDLKTRRQDELVPGAGTLIGILMGRRSTRSMSSAASKRSTTRKAQQRVQRSQAKVDAKLRDLDELEDEVTEEVLAIDAEWRVKADDIETLEIGLEKTDIRIAARALVWIPVD